MKQKLFTIFIFLFLSFSLVLSKLRTRSTADLKMLNKLSEEVKDFNSNMNDLDKEEENSTNSSINSQTENISSGIKEVVKSLSEQFEEYKKSLEEESSQNDESEIESVKEKSQNGLNIVKDNYLDEIKKVTSELSQTVSALVKVDKNEHKKEEVQEKLQKIQQTKQKFKDAHENIKYLRTLKENNDLLRENKENAKHVMANLINLYNEYLSIEENLKNRLDVNLSDIKEDFAKSNNLLSNIDFFSNLFEKLEKFYFMLEESSSMEKDKVEKFQEFIQQTNKLDTLNKNLDAKIEQEIVRVKKISNQHDRLNSLNKLLRISNILKSLNEKVLELKDEVCKRMKNSLETNLEKVADLIKNPNKNNKDSSSLLNRSLTKISEEHKKAVDDVKSKILTHLNDVQDLIKSNMKSFSDDSLNKDKMGVGKTVVQKFSLIDKYFGELKSLNNSFDEKKKMKINKLIANAKNVINQLKELAENSRNILNILERTNSKQKVIKDEYNNIVEKIESLKSNIRSNEIIDHKLIDQMNSQIQNYSEMFENLKTGEVQTSIQKRTLKRLANTNEALLQKMNVNKFLEEIEKLEKLKK